jgi:phosphopantetheinyl transferase (holo-ACP synthase)
VAKALGLDGLTFREIEVVSDGGKPTIRLAGKAAARADALGVKVQVSLTHTRRDAAAVAIAAPVRLTS